MRRISQVWRYVMTIRQSMTQPCAYFIDYTVYEPYTEAKLPGKYSETQINQSCHLYEYSEEVLYVKVYQSPHINTVWLTEILKFLCGFA